MARGASAPSLQLLPQGREGLLLGPLHGHGADLQPLGGSAERQTLEDGEPQSGGLGRGELIDQLLQRLGAESCLQRLIGGGCRQLIEQGMLAIGMGIETEMPKGALPLLMEAMGNAHQADPIAEVMLERPADAAAQIGPSGLTCSAAWSGADQGLAGHLDQIFPLHQREQAPGGRGSDGIRQWQMLQHQSITGLEGRAAQALGLLTEAGGRKRGSHREDGAEPHPQRPAAARWQGRPEAMPPGAPGLILAIARGVADGIRWVCASPVAICSPWPPDSARLRLCRNSHHLHDSLVRVVSCGVPALQAAGVLAIHCSSQTSGR